MISIRRATPADAVSIAAVQVATWQTAYHNLMPDEFLDGLSVEEKTASWGRNLTKHQHCERNRTLVAVRDDKVIGFATVGRLGDDENLGLLYLLYVLPTHWGCGVGKALMAAAVEELRDLELGEAILWVLRENVQARRFYERLGWHADGCVRSDHYGRIELEAIRYRRVVG